MSEDTKKSNRKKSSTGETDKTIRGQTKKVTAFVGSGRSRGTTLASTRQLLEKLESFGDIQTEIVRLGKHDLGLCRGCKTCFTRGEERCPLNNDDRDLLIEKMMDSDGVIFASPNYSFQVSSIMKVFLDRLGFLFHRPRFHGKTFSGIVVQGIYGGKEIVKYLDLVGSGLGFHTVKGRCITALEPMEERDRQKIEETVTKQAQQFYKQMLKPRYPTPSILHLMFFRMARTSMRQMLGEDNRDYCYYRDKGWFESEYYYPTKLGPLKRTLGKFFDWMFSRIYKPKQENPEDLKIKDGYTEVS